MIQSMMPSHKAQAISNGVFLIGLGILFYTNEWWPGIILVIWAALALRQGLTGRYYDVLLTSLVLLGLFIFSFYDLKWSVIAPVLFVLGGIFIIFREFFFTKDTNGEEKSEEIKDDVEDGK
jgi:hypothetical protein